MLTLQKILLFYIPHATISYGITLLVAEHGYYMFCTIKLRTPFGLRVGNDWFG